jgi:hypothetical protein
VRLSAVGAALPRSVLALFVCAIVTLAVFGQLPGGSVFWTTLQNFAHCPAFVAISVILITLRPRGQERADRRWVAYLVTLVACLLLGVGIEIAQSLIGGDVSAQDVFTDMAGSTIGLSWHALARRSGGGGRWNAGHWLIALTGTASFVATAAPVGWMLVAYAHRDLAFPTLAAARSPLDLFFLEADEGTPVIGRLPEAFSRTRDERGIRVNLRAGSAGVFLIEPVADWSAYQTLAIDLANPSNSPKTLRLRVHDRRHNQQVDDRFNQSLLLPPLARQTWRFALAGIRSAPATRQMHLDEIAGIGLFDLQPRDDATFYLNRMWLERAAD